MEDGSFKDMPNLVIEDYIDAVSTLARNRNELTFNNTDPEQAAIVMATIIDNAESQVRIYENSLKGDIADTHKNFERSLRNFLQAGKHVSIVLRDDSECDSIIFDQICELSNDYPKNIDVRIASEDFRSNIKDVMTKDVYFIVGDELSYRMETIEEITHERKAICSFNRPPIASKLKGAFDAKFFGCKRKEFPVHA
ncbi:MAG: hypothetical protein INR73_17910 [Williamsia sp.]|nr:hypothetical protein [Williamsia sp.]